VTPLNQQHSQQQPVAPLAAPLLLPKAAATGSQLRQPHNRTAAAGSSSRLPTSKYMLGTLLDTTRLLVLLSICYKIVASGHATNYLLVGIFLAREVLDFGGVFALQKSPGIS
jgi:hypothetical protein